MRAATLMIITAALAGAQTTTTPPFTITAGVGTTTQVLDNNGIVALQADAIGAPADATITLSYTGMTFGVTMNIISLAILGSNDFALVNPPTLPVNLTTRDRIVILRVRYMPTSSKQVTGKLNVTYADTNSTKASTLTVNFVATAPEFAFTSMVLPNGNNTLLNAGDTVVLPPTNFEDTSAAQITISNRGTAPGVVQGINYTGPASFVLANVPFPPATIDPGKSLSFSVRFTPEDFDPVSGTVTITALGKSLTFKVQGSGQGPWIEYEVLTDSGSRPLDPGGLITLPDATIGGEKTTVTIRVVNNGNLDGRVQALNISGAAFSLIESPFVPLTLTPGASFTAKIQFAPTQPGKTAGRLRIGSDNFEVEGTGLGHSLTYSFTAGSATVAVQSPGTVVMPAAAVGETSNVRFTVKNEGTAPTDVVSITISGPASGTVFTLGDLPALPRRIEAGASVSFGVTFAPVVTGSATATLKVDTQSFTLSGSGNPPAALPAYSFQGTGGTVDAMQQPAVGLALGETYPLALTGALTLTFTSDSFSNDPAVQFSSGGRTIPFTIPAGSKQAVFPNNANQVRVQTGTVAGTITLTPSFATQQGGIDLTPQSPPSFNLVVPQSAPRLLNVVVQSKTSTGFTLLVTGYATGRSITQMDFQVTPISTEKLASTKVSLNVEPTFTAWYQGTSSAAYGSQFTATVPFTLAGDITDTENVKNLIETLQSVSVTLTNRQGVSASRSVDLK